MRRVRYVLDGKTGCATCGEQKPLNEFHKATNSPIGVAYICKPCTAAKAVQWGKKNFDRLSVHRKNAQRQRKIRVMSAYCNGHPACACCGESEIAFLSIDHINGGGTAHRRQIGKVNFYHWLIKNEFPDGFQVLCYNCNCAKKEGATCPHKR